MTQQTIMIIRHANRPEPDGSNGVDVDCNLDPESLLPLGWVRAGVWQEIFAPSSNQIGPLPKPTAIFASVPRHHASKSQRPMQTVTPLAQKIGMAIDLTFAKGDEIALANAVSGIGGPVLVCWQHEHIIDIAKALKPTDPLPTTDWPDDRYNLVFRFDRADQTAKWSFRQIAFPMMTGDSLALIP